MTTLEAIQKLDDGQFHRLGDDLIRRLEPRYRRLRTHGLNDKGESIKGQPDSYVGETANTCEIAFAYSVQRKSWWTKIVQDIKEVVQASPGVKEVVIAISRDVNREGPKGKKGKKVDWLAEVRKEAGSASVRIYDGRELAGYLDNRGHQDLRYDHLRVPYSRLSGESIVKSCQVANARTIEGLSASGRYDPKRYIFRKSDDELYRLWQHALRLNRNKTVQDEAVRLLPLVNDAGVGKTSLLCSFVESLGAVLPVILIAARDLSDEGPHGLVRSVIERMQGCLDPAIVSQEETAILHHLSQDVPLTVIVDGLDEAKDVHFVKRSIRQWLQSALGQSSLLLVSSRPEFWRQCSSNENWYRWMPRTRGDDRKPTATSGHEQDRSFDATAGFRLPDQFSNRELERAWLQAGRTNETLHALTDEVRAELRHPFTLRVFLELSGKAAPQSPCWTRTDIVACWLDGRLAAEEDAAEYLTRSVYHEALRKIATRIRDKDAASIGLDELSDIPRCETTSPPGPVVRRLLSANILEVIPEEPSKVRFSLEVVQDFFLAEAEVQEVVSSPIEAATNLGKQVFSKIRTRLGRIGQRIQSHHCRNDFVASLTCCDPAKAAVVVQSAPMAYEPSVRSTVVQALAQEIHSPCKAKGAFAVELLGDINSPESIACLLESLKPSAECPYHLRTAGTTALARLGPAEGAAFAYLLPWFCRSTDDAYYFNDLIGVFRSASPEFRKALSDLALAKLSVESGTSEHYRAICVLGYLADGRIVPHLEQRLASNGILRQYENHALFAVGTDAAARLYIESARNVAKLIDEDRKANPTRRDDNLNLFFSVGPMSADLRYLMTPPFEAAIIGFVRDDDKELSYLGLGIARGIRSAKLVYELLTSGKWSDVALSDTYELGAFITPMTWLEWWNETKDSQARTSLLSLAGGLAHPQIEAILISCCDDPDVRKQSYATSQLGRMGSYRGIPALRTVLQQALDAQNYWLCISAITALSRIRDPGAVSLLHRATELGGIAAFYAVEALAAIGSDESEASLVALLEQGGDEAAIAGALVAHGSSTAVAKAISLAKVRTDGPKWLGDCFRHVLFLRGHKKGQYYQHIWLEELIPYLASDETLFKDNLEKWGLVHNIEQLDGGVVRKLLHEWAARKDTATDCIVRDDGVTFATLAYWELAERGDDYAVPFYVSEAVSDDERRSWKKRNLVQFSSTEVSKELRKHLASQQNPSTLARTIRLLGFFGTETDAGLVTPHLNSQDATVADAAFEACVRLSDPLRLPKNWGGL